MIKVLLAGGCPLVVHGIRQILGDTLDIVPVLETWSSEQLLEKVRTHTLLDLVVVVVALGAKGDTLAGMLTSLHLIRPGLPVVVLGENDAPTEASPGVCAWLPVDTSSEVLVAQIRNAARHGTFVKARDFRTANPPLPGTVTEPRTNERRQAHEEA